MIIIYDVNGYSTVSCQVVRWRPGSKSTHVHQQKRDVHRMPVQSWPTVRDAGPALYRHWVNVPCWDVGLRGGIHQVVLKRNEKEGTPEWKSHIRSFLGHQWANTGGRWVAIDPWMADSLVAAGTARLKSTFTAEDKSVFWGCVEL